MAIGFRMVGVSILSYVVVAGVYAAEEGGSVPTSKEDALKRFEVVLERVRADALKASSDSYVDGVGHRGENDRPTEVNTVYISPYTHIGCGCCGEGDVPSTFSDNDMACLAPIDSITSLDIQRSQITDSGLRHLAGLSRLKQLDLSDNAVTDEGLNYLAGLANLESLTLSRTRIKGPGLAHLAKLRRLRLIQLDGSLLTEDGLASLPELPDLESFNAKGTKTGGPGMTAFCRTPNLRDLYLGNTSADDVGLSHLAGLTQLRTLQLDNTKVSDTGLSYLAGLTKLRELTMGRTKVSDAGLVHLSGLNELWRLDLIQTRVRGEGLRQLGNLTKLAWLNVSCEGRYPVYSKELIAVLSRLEKLPSLFLETSWPASAPPAQREVDIFGMKFIQSIQLRCPDGAETIRLCDLPKLDSVCIDDLIPTACGDSLPASPARHARIAEIRIQGCKSLTSLNILMPEQMVISDLERVNLLTLHGVLKAESLKEFRKIELKVGLSLEAFSGSEPSSLAVFADKFDKKDDGCRRLELSVDTFNKAWRTQLQATAPAAKDIWLQANTVDGDACLAELATIAALKSLTIRDTSSLSSEAITAFRKARPEVFLFCNQPTAGGQ